MGKDPTPQHRAMHRFEAIALPDSQEAPPDEAILTVCNTNPEAVAQLHPGVHLILKEDSRPVAVRDRSVTVGHLYQEGEDWIRLHARVSCVFQSHGPSANSDFTIRVTGYAR